MSSSYIDVLNNSDKVYLSELIPSVLFSETNLPEVKIVERSIIRGKFLEGFEQPSLALTQYSLSKVTFRLNDSLGDIFVLNKLYYIKNGNKVYLNYAAKISKEDLYEAYPLENVAYPRNLSNFLKYAKYLLGDDYKYININDLEVKPYRPLKLYVKPFHLYWSREIEDTVREKWNIPPDEEIPHDLKKYHWTLHRKSLMPYSYLLTSRKFNIITLLDEKTKSYPMIDISGTPSEEGKIFLYIENIKKLLGVSLFKRILLKEIYKSIYAYDVYYVLRKYKTGFPPKRLKTEYRPCVKILFAEEKIEENRKNITPILLAYNIENTNALKFTYSLIKDFNTWITRNLRDFNNNYEYYKNFIQLTIVDNIIKFLKFILISDLRLKYIYSPNFKYLLDLAISYNDIVLNNSLGKIIVKELKHNDFDLQKCRLNNINYILKEIIHDFILRYNDSTREEKFKIDLFINMLFSRYVKSLKRILKQIDSSHTNNQESSEVLDRINDELKYLTFSNAINYILVHSLIHHFISYVITRSGAADDQIQGCMRNPLNVDPSIFEDFLQEAYLYEESSGGLGIIDSAFADINTYSNALKIDSIFELIHSFIINLGDCTIGVPEYILRVTYYYANRKCINKNISDFLKAINKSIKALNIIITYDELNQTYSLFNSLISELELFAEGNETRAYKIFCDIQKAVKDLIEHIHRTPSIDEVAFWIILNIEDYHALEEIIIDKVARAYMGYYRNRRIKSGEEEGTVEEFLKPYIFETLKRSRIDNYEQAKKFIKTFIRDLGNSIKCYSILLNLCKNNNSLQKAVIFIARVLHNMVKTMFYREFLISCSDACGWCLINSRGCNVSRDVSLQAYILSWRLLKIFSVYLLSQIERGIGEVKVIEGKEYSLNQRPIVSFYLGSKVVTFYWCKDASAVQNKS